MRRELRITLDECFLLLDAILRRALLDAHGGSQAQQQDAMQFLDHICPAWRTHPNLHQKIKLIPAKSPKRLAKRYA